MSQNIQIAYRGYEIRFREDSEQWYCLDLEIPDTPKLSAVKRRIDELSKSDRRLDLPAIYIGYRGETRRITATVLCEAERDYETKTMAVSKCWGINEEGKREKFDLKSLIPIEHEADVAAWEAADVAANEARDKANRLKAALTTYNADTIMLAAREAKAAKKEKAS